MCGRFTLTPEPSELLDMFPDLVIPSDVARRYNVAPTDQVLAVTQRHGERALELLKWGLIPSWAKDPKIGNSLINARSDSVETKPAFRSALRKRRCLILADGFYEWKKDGKQRRPFYFRVKDTRVFTLAGLWEIWKPSDDAGYVLSCTIITSDANELVGEVHDRMPVILPPSARDAWLDADGVDADAAVKLLKPYPAGEMTSWEVSKDVNSPRNDTPSCVVPLDAVVKGETSKIEPLDLF